MVAPDLLPRIDAALVLLQRVALEYRPAAFVVQQPVFAESYATDRSTGAFILIDAATNHTVAAGMIE